MSEKYIGKVKFFNEERGFGFIKPEVGEDIYVHASFLIGEDVNKLNVDDHVSFTKAKTDRGWQAENVTILDKN